MNEQRDIESRKNNIIIYGIEEPIRGTEEKEQEQDKKEIKEILYIIGAQDIIPTHHRIGKKDENGLKQRPIKMILKSASEKEKIMQNLHKLKPYGNWLGLSIRDDFTINERKRIKENCQEAKNLNKRTMVISSGV